MVLIVPAMVSAVSKTPFATPSQSAGGGFPNRLNRGNDVSVYYGAYGGGEWPHQGELLSIILFLKAACCQLRCPAPGGKQAEVPVRARNICIIAPGLEGAWQIEGEAEILALYIEPDLVGKVAGQLSGLAMINAAEHDGVIWMLALLLRHLCTRPVRSQPRTIDAVGGELAHCLLALWSDQKEAAPHLGRCLSASQCQKVMRYVEDNLKYDIHVVDLAKQTGHSASHFSELFTNTTGRSPYHYLKEARVLRAYELLLTGDYLVREAAEAVGYSNADHFAEVFQEFSGCSARELIRRIRHSPRKSRPSPEEHRERISRPSVKP
ncbi:MAG: AraC family transcriptional regulator [Casimicrobiaceae bacterium]